MIRKFQYAPGTGTPVFINDLTYMSEEMIALRAALQSEGRQTYILSEFKRIPDSANPGYSGNGLIFYDGQLYQMEEDFVPQGSYLYVNTREVDERVAQNNSTFYAYTEYYATYDSTPTNTSKGTLIDSRPLTNPVVEDLKKPPIADRAITGDQIGVTTISNINLASSCIHDANIIAGTITNRSIKDNTITNAKIQQGTILPSTLASSFPQSRYQQISCNVTLIRVANRGIQYVVEWASVQNKGDLEFFFTPNSDFSQIDFYASFKGQRWIDSSVVTSASVSTGNTGAFIVKGGGLDGLNNTPCCIDFLDEAVLPEMQRIAFTCIFYVNTFDN